MMWLMHISHDYFCEPALTLPRCDDAEVIVCGGGPAGVSAALAAARAGARVRLFEWRGCLGGVWTAGLLGYLLDFDKPGLARELSIKLTERDARRGTEPWAMVYEPEAMKVLLEELCDEAGVTVQLHTRAAAAYREGRRLQTLMTESKSGRQAWRAPVFIDATGDGDLGALAGCSWELGNPRDATWQPMSLNAMLVCADAAALSDCLHGSDLDGRSTEAKKHFFAELRRAGHDPSYAQPTLWQVRDNLLLVMLNHAYGIKPFDAAAVTRATMDARREIHAAVNALRQLGGPWTGLAVAATAEQIGVRDGRRLAGRYTVTAEDLVAGSRHDDAVVRVTLPVDIHGVKKEHAAVSDGGVRARPYDIPLRALVAREVDGLLMAGRCISGDFIAHGSYRVTGNAVAMGEAAGTVAALAARSGKLPHEVPWADTQPYRRGNAVHLPEMAPWVK